MIRRLLELVGSVLPVFLIAFLVLVVAADVFARNILRVPFYAAHDLAILAFSASVWLGLIGAALYGQLFGIGFFVELLPERLRRVVVVLSHIIVIIIAVAVIQAAIAQITTARFTTFLALGWPKWIVAAILAVGMGGIIIVQLVAIVEIFRGEGADA
ncbi:TRAP transporter small permease [Pelagibacterium lacus]|uniref:TRAP transporter small permease protein n=2 Tax=Pelagibacterium lacus TaxID=2282655 RepID=A0A369W6R7_9HYPH|nr:TRAP transporter small permease [Pelagibacterium lacus]